MMRHSIMRSVAVLAVIAACNEPYTRPINEDATPEIESILIKSGIVSGEETEDEIAAFDYVLDEAAPGAFYPWSYPWFRVNKLLDGETLEVVEQDAATGKELAQCHAVAGAAEVVAATQAVDPLRVCWNPGTRVITVQASDSDNAPLPFLLYDTEYVFAVTENIKDKAGRALVRKELRVRTPPFRVESVMTTDHEVPMYGATGSPFALGTDPIEVPKASSLSFRVFFTGSVGGDMASFAGVRLLDAMGNDVVLQDETGADVKAELLNLATEDTHDPRILLVNAPLGKPLAVGDYRLVLPVTLTDDGTVTGDPVPLSQAVDVAFSVVPDPKH